MKDSIIININETKSTILENAKKSLKSQFINAAQLQLNEAVSGSRSNSPTESHTSLSADTRDTSPTDSSDKDSSSMDFNDLIDNIVDPLNTRYKQYFPPCSVEKDILDRLLDEISSNCFRLFCENFAKAKNDNCIVIKWQEFGPIKGFVIYEISSVIKKFQDRILLEDISKEKINHYIEKIDVHCLINDTYKFIEDEFKKSADQLQNDQQDLLSPSKFEPVEQISCPTPPVSPSPLDYSMLNTLDTPNISRLESLAGESAEPRGPTPPIELDKSFKPIPSNYNVFASIQDQNTNGKNDNVSPRSPRLPVPKLSEVPEYNWKMAARMYGDDNEPQPSENNLYNQQESYQESYWSPDVTHDYYAEDCTDEYEDPDANPKDEEDGGFPYNVSKDKSECPSPFRLEDLDGIDPSEEVEASEGVVTWMSGPEEEYSTNEPNSDRCLTPPLQFNTGLPCGSEQYGNEVVAMDSPLVTNSQSNFNNLALAQLPLLPRLPGQNLYVDSPCIDENVILTSSLKLIAMSAIEEYFNKHYNEMMSGKKYSLWVPYKDNADKLKVDGMKQAIMHIVNEAINEFDFNGLVRQSELDQLKISLLHKLRANTQKILADFPKNKFNVLVYEIFKRIECMPNNQVLEEEENNDPNERAGGQRHSV